MCLLWKSGTEHPADFTSMTNMIIILDNNFQKRQRPLHTLKILLKKIQMFVC